MPMLLFFFEFGFMFLPFLIPSFIFIVIVVISFVAIVKHLSKQKILRKGSKRMAKYINYYTGRVDQRFVNDRLVSSTQYYGFYYEFKADNGKMLKGKSPDSYTMQEIEMFKSASYFEVFVLGDESMVAGVPSKQDAEKFLNISKQRKCAYCGSMVSLDDKKCPHCGASNYEELL